MPKPKRGAKSGEDAFFSRKYKVNNATSRLFGLERCSQNPIVGLWPRLLLSLILLLYTRGFITLF